jgi:hypothetical protein
MQKDTAAEVENGLVSVVMLCYPALDTAVV